MKLSIRNMVCNRCIAAVQNLLSESGIGSKTITLGEVETNRELSKAEIEALSAKLENLGFELLDDRKSQIADRIRTLIIDLVHRQNAELNVPLSAYLSDALAQDYSALSNLFSQMNGTTIEQYFISQKIERVRELLAYDEYNLNEIADLLHYSSPSHLSRQFKSLTGMTPSAFRSLRTGRKPLDQV